MPRKLSTIAPDWWDYTTLDDDLIAEAARLTPADMGGLSRDGFRIVFYDTLEEFYLAEALEYIGVMRHINLVLIHVVKLFFVIVNSVILQKL